MQLVTVSLYVSPQFTSDSKALTGLKITDCLGLYHWKGLHILHFFTYISCHSCETSCIKSRYGVVCLHTNAQITFCFYWHRLCLSQQFQFTPVVLTNPNETLHLCCLEGVWGAWAGWTSQNPASLAELLWVRVRSDGTKFKPGTWCTSHTSGAHDCVQGHPREVEEALPQPSYFRLECREI